MALADETAATPPSGRHVAGLALIGMTLAGTLLLAATGLGEGVNPIVGPLSVAQSLLSSGVLALAYIGAGVGLAGPITARLAGGSAHRWWLQVALGTGGIFWLSHLAGVLGGLSGAHGRWVALAILATGLVMLLAQLAKELRTGPRLPAIPSTALLSLVGLTVLLCAACSPPGALWRSEANGFDSLSYHLPLPQQWAAGSALRPLNTNVYSWLPSYYEAGLLHLSALLGGGTPTAGVPSGLLAFDGVGAIAAHLLAALTTIISGAMAGRVTTCVLRRAGLADRVATAAGGLAFSILVSTPWSVVCGSMAYNEMAVTAMFAGAVLAAIDESLTPKPRWLLAGLLTGLACGFKPTAMFIAAPTVGLLLISGANGKGWVRLAMVGVIGGVITFAPPLIRNTIAGGNPVFPAGAGLFGRAHWSAEQVDRFAAGHREAAPLGQRAAMLISSQPDPGSLDTPKQPRGFMHRQWAMVPVAGIFAAAALTIWPVTRRFGLCTLAGIVAACVWWIGFSHAQSRFLLPLVAPFSVSIAVLVGIAVASVSRTRVWAVVLLLGLTPVAAGATTLLVFMIQNGQSPNGLLGVGTSGLTGEDVRPSWAGMGPSTRQTLLANRPANVAANLLVPPDQTIYLFGGSTPFYFTGRVLCHTTWDTCPLASPMALHPDDPSRWAEALQALGVSYILLDLAELQRLRASGWYDPRVTPEAAMRLATEQCDVIARWERGVVLLHLRPVKPRPASTEGSA